MRVDLYIIEAILKLFKDHRLLASLIKLGSGLELRIKPEGSDSKLRLKNYKWRE